MPTDAALRAAKAIAEMDARIGGRDWHWHYIETAAEIIDREWKREQEERKLEGHANAP